MIRATVPAALFALLITASACSPSALSPTPSEGPPSGWAALPKAPLSARHGAYAFWTGTEVLVLGGRDDAPCPPNADCMLPEGPALRDGAAFDPVAGAWRAMADAPVGLGIATGAVADGSLHLLVREVNPVGLQPAAFLRYDIAADEWHEQALPPEPSGINALVGLDGQVVAVRGSHEQGVAPDVMWDPAEARWDPLPGDPLAPSFDRTLVWTGRELVLLGLPLVRQPNSTEPSLYRAASFDPATRSWRDLPDPQIVGGSVAWFSTGGSIVNPAFGSSDGGEGNNWGRSYPFGGILTPPAGEWEELPARPAERAGWRGLSTGGGEHVVSADGWVLDVPGREWAVLPPPPDTPETGHAHVWAGDRLVVWGGVRWDGERPVLLDSGWGWRP